MNPYRSNYYAPLVTAPRSKWDMFLTRFKRRLVLWLASWRKEDRKYERQWRQARSLGKIDFQHHLRYMYPFPSQVQANP